jgi:hypothetical protein
MEGRRGTPKIEFAADVENVRLSGADRKRLAPDRNGAFDKKRSFPRFSSWSPITPRLIEHEHNCVFPLFAARFGCHHPL